MIKLLLDASAIISWCEELGNLEVKNLLESNGYELVITDSVKEEVLKNNVTDLHREVVETAEIVETDEEKLRRLSGFNPRLGDGEVSIISVGEQLHGTDEKYLCVLDDKLARKTCEKKGLNRTGSIGLLNLLVEEDLISENTAKEKLQQMDENGARLPDDYESLIGEEVKKRAR